jgi:cytochrome oxidase Cu insertion factor (SCO1/SenC/PrrC family)
MKQMCRTPALCLAVVWLALAPIAAQQPAAQQPATQPAAGPELKVGDMAPDFTLQASDGQTYSLAKLRGRTVVLAWFPKAFTAG